MLVSKLNLMPIVLLGIWQGVAITTLWTAQSRRPHPRSTLMIL
jgi:hypothetical protein